MFSLGQALKKARYIAGLTRAEAALKIGVTARSIARWEKDEREPSFEMLCNIAKCYSTNLAALMGMVEYID